MKKFLSLLLAVVMVLSVAAFADEISVENAPDVWAETWADVDTSKHVVVNYMTTGPIIFLYPFVQRYFIGGMTVGAVKG